MFSSLCLSLSQVSTFLPVNFAAGANSRKHTLVVAVVAVDIVVSCSSVAQCLHTRTSKVTTIMSEKCCANQ